MAKRTQVTETASHSCAWKVGDWVWSIDMNDIQGPFETKEALLENATEKLMGKNLEHRSFMVGRVGQVIPFSMAVGIETAKHADRMHSTVLSPAALSCLADAVKDTVEDWMKKLEISNEFCFSVQYIEKCKIEDTFYYLN